MPAESRELRVGVLLPDPDRCAQTAALESALDGEGFAVARVELGPAGGPGDPVRALDERAALIQLDDAARDLARRADVDPRRVAALGIAAGGTLAFVAACTSRFIHGCVALDAPLVHAALGPLRPMQPIERAANLCGPALFVFGPRSAAVPREHRELLRTRLDQLGKSFRILEADGDARWQALLAFLREEL